MRSLLAFLLVLAAGSSAYGQGYSKTEYFEAYARVMPRETIALRMEQIYDALGPAAKTQASATLKAELLAQLQTILDQYQTVYITPTETDISNVNDTTLP